MKIAIIGCSGLFPGSETMDSFWSNLLSGKDLIGVATETEFGAPPEIFYEAQKGTIDKCYSLRAGFVRGFEFDPHGYQLSAKFLSGQDRSIQWSLHVAREALRESGYLGAEVLERCGVVLGSLSFPTLRSHQQLAHLYTQALEPLLADLLQHDDFRFGSGGISPPSQEIVYNVPSGMVARGLGLGAGHYSLDAACASSLYAIKLACDELVLGKADLMLAGAVCASAPLFIHMGFSIFHAYAGEGEVSAPFDTKSGGLVSAEGAGAVVLKRWEDARRDGDQILGVIPGIGLSNDGRGKFILSPNPKGQRLALERAYTHGASPKDTVYLECHATGTPLGDVTELNSISDFFQPYGTAPLLGSVKSNMGHLLTAAGMPGIFKALLSLQHGVIPGSLHIQEPLEADNQFIRDEHVLTQTTNWTGWQAGVNSFGFGGTNAHMVIQSPDAEVHHRTPPSPQEPRPQPGPISIVGMDAHFAGCAGLSEFYSTIYHGQQHFRDLPTHRWRGFEANEDILRAYGFADGKAPWGAYIDTFEFDLLRYKIQPNEMETLAPQQALILRVADQALRDAGIEEGQTVGVIIAMEPEPCVHHYLARWDTVWQLEEALERAGIELEESERRFLLQQCRNAMHFRESAQSPSKHTSFIGNVMASRIAALWDLNGPAFTISCGEHSAFKALEIARNILGLGEVDAVLVGGVDLAGGFEHVLLRNLHHPCGQGDTPSMSWNTSDLGWRVGEGAGAVVLQRAEDARQDRVYATLEPSSEALSSPGYVELVASGIAADDQREMESLIRSRQHRNGTDTLETAVGSIKANIGHAGAAAGMASVIKTVLCLHHRFIPGIPNWRAPKNRPALVGTPVYFPENSRPWFLNAQEDARRAAIHTGDGRRIEVREAGNRPRNGRAYRCDHMALIFPLHGNSADEILTAMDALATSVQGNMPLAEVAAQVHQRWEQGRGHFCASIVARDASEVLREVNHLRGLVSRAIAEAMEAKTPKGSYFTGRPLASFGREGKVAFVYPGAATAYPGLAKDVFQLFPRLHQEFAPLVPNLAETLGCLSLFPRRQAVDLAPPELHKDATAMMSAGAISACLYTHLARKVLKLQPDMAFGYSLGECVSMWFANRVWSLENIAVRRHPEVVQSDFSGDLNLLANAWGISSAEAKARWVSLILLHDKDDVAKWVARFPRVDLTFVNTPQEVIISGEREDCFAIARHLGCHSTEVPFQNVIHQSFCETVDDKLVAVHDYPVSEKPAMTFYSSLDSRPIPFEREAIAQNSARVLYHPVDFPKTCQHLYDEGARIFVELGANATCTEWIQSNLAGKPHLAVSLNKKGKTDAQSIVEASARLLSHGLRIDVVSLYGKKDEAPSGPQFTRQIQVGGTPIAEHFLSDENRARFRSRGVDQRRGRRNKNLEIQTMKIPMKTELIPEATRRVAENGLPLQDYSTGEHLRGKSVIFSQEDLQEFATGKIGKVFGPDYDVIDSYSRRVMLPMHPYLLVSRITGLDATRGEFKPSTIQTEYDIPYGAWFTTDGQIPWAVSVESGQCDLMLISYLGIDFQNKGERVYRLLDCTLTFVDDMPFEGQTLRYDISITSFAKTPQNLLFFFQYDCYVGDRLVLKMRDGCAGFFTDEQLAGGNGVMYTEDELRAKQECRQPKFFPLLHTEKTSYDKEDLRHLIRGDMEACFGNESYFANGRNPSLRLPPEQILMIDRIVSVDLEGGAWGLGLIVAELDLHPNDWFFPCHFRDDEVLAGSLQAEGGGNLLRFFMLLLGMQRLTKDARFQPVYDLPQNVRCRKQVVPQRDTKLVYRLEVKEISLVPHPKVIADLEILSDGVITVFFKNLGLQLREKSNPKYLETTPGIPLSPRSEGALMNEEDLTIFALDKLSKCFGPDFACYDNRATSHQPGGDLQMISRLLRVDGERLNFKGRPTVYAEYDVPEDAWYYEQFSNPTMPSSILMEIALQPCGVLSMYLGSTLPFSEEGLFLRNLDGTGNLAPQPGGMDYRGKTIHNKSVMISSTAYAGTVLQSFTFELSIDGEVFYSGTSSFGYFLAESLENQIGLDDGEDCPPWIETQKLQPSEYTSVNLDSPYGKLKLFTAPEGKPFYRLGQDQFNLLNRLKLMRDGGLHGQGYIYAYKHVRAYDWFFTCHFYQDPVMPGSLGLESILQAMQTFVLHYDLAKEFRNPKFVQLDNHTTIWKYRGQIRPDDEHMHMEVHIKRIERIGDKLALIGDANLWKQNMRIYHITDLALGIQEA